MTTEAKIKEAFDTYIREMITLYSNDPDMLNAIKRERQHGLAMFVNGYMALLNELEPVSTRTKRTGIESLYALPEGVTK